MASPEEKAAKIAQLMGVSKNNSKAAEPPKEEPPEEKKRRPGPRPTRIPAKDLPAVTSFSHCWHRPALLWTHLMCCAFRSGFQATASCRAGVCRARVDSTQTQFTEKYTRRNIAAAWH